ncbi:hypothetical protein TRFO_02311 [Tritrichomonas foetus]|uniref:Uncharacterized protein n=1 Tax=Tritrichomonas foetus TaxID=1144522 RepID=A0A1J4J2W9_9EUKA|nr:hypothetical protein TRFO_02311 [Tritrichomonas foetus]|eukprot:OHS93800.1 hypothetical protein TRFO_02311 [Tritrichomonas foetus]
MQNTFTHTKYDYKTDFDISPVTENQRDLFYCFFKPCYVDKIIEYCESCPYYKKDAIVLLVESASGQTTRPYTAPTYKNDVNFTLNGGFGLSYNFSGKRSARKVNPLRFSSSGIKDNGIFGYPQIESQVSRKIAKSEVRANPHTHMMVTRFFKPSKVSEVLMVADEHTAALKDLLRGVGKANRGGASTSFSLTTPRKNTTNLTSPLPQAFTNRGFGPAPSTTTIMNDFTPTKPENTIKSMAGTKSRAVSSLSQRQTTAYGWDDSPGKEFSVRMKDASFREMYKTDTRWAPRMFVPGK